MNPILENLNTEQLKAIQHFEGPLLVMAGAGSGKTKVLTHRIAYLIQEKNISPYSVLAITFTNKAAKEMKSRVIDLVGEVGKHMFISTFHAMCVRILRQDIDLIGYTGNFVIYDDKDSLEVIKNALKDLNLDKKQFPPKKIKNMISNAKNDYLFPKDLKKRVDDEFSDIVYRVYEKYQNALRKANALDFDDLIMLTIKLFERHEDVLNYYQRKFQFILVDEYQDTNKSQFKLVKLLSKRHHNIFVVGDADQSIYSWRGADIRNIIDFEKDFLNEQKEVGTIYLEQNYRSFQEILDCANSVIMNNYDDDKYVKKLWSDKRASKHPITYYRAVNSDVETEYIAQKIIDKMRHEKLDLNDFAVLYRTNAMSLALERVFMKYDIDYEIYGNVGFFDRREIKDLVAYLRLIVNTNDNVSFERIVNVPKRGIGKTTVEKLRAHAERLEISSFDAIDSIDLSARAKNGLIKFKELMNQLKKDLDDIDINDYIDLVLEKTEYLNTLVLENTDEARGRIENLEEFKTLTLDLEEDLSDEGIFTQDLTAYEKLCLILNNITLASDTGEKKEHAVKMMTIHAAKGLEFPIVFIYGVEDNIFPLGGDDKIGEEMQEERRLMYVAITRAKNELYITNSEMRKIYGSYRVNPESRFIHEIDSDLLNIQGVRKIKKMTKDKPLDFAKRRSSENKNTIKIGAKVKHSRFGEGVVVQTEGDICTVAFEAGIGVRKVDANYLTVKKEKKIHPGTKIVHSRFGEGVIISIEGDRGTVAFNTHGIKKLDIHHPSITIK